MHWVALFAIGVGLDYVAYRQRRNTPQKTAAVIICRNPECEPCGAIRKLAEARGKGVSVEQVTH